jgi:threonine/homoserine/homoserine lactone efflux protein
MTLAGFVAYSAALAIAAAIPGPGIIALVARALGSGDRSTVPMAMGLAVGDIVYLAAAVMGLAFVAQTFGTAFLVVKYAGIAYLLYLAFKLWNAGLSAERVEARRAEGFAASFLSGLVVTLGNPKVMVFYLALLPTILDLRTVSAGDFLVLAGLTFAILMVVLLPYVALAARARGLLSTPHALRRLNRTAAAIMVGAAAAIATRT